MDDTYCGSPNKEILIYITTDKHKIMLLRDGYHYYRHKINKNNSTLWTCANRNECSSSLTISSDERVIRESPHRCSPDFVRNEIFMNVEMCKYIVTDDDDGSKTPKDRIINVRKKKPKVQNLKKSTIYKIRNKLLL